MVRMSLGCLFILPGLIRWEHLFKRFGTLGIGTPSMGHIRGLSRHSYAWLLGDPDFADPRETMAGERASHGDVRNCERHYA